jgi:hypothetical protein
VLAAVPDPRARRGFALPPDSDLGAWRFARPWPAPSRSRRSRGGPLIGAIKLKELTADQVDEWLEGLTGKLTTRSLQGVDAILKRAIRQAQARDRVLRNVAELVSTPKGKQRRPSRAVTLEQATAMLEEAKASRLHAYVTAARARH